ncbi:hypothetical protein WB388_08550 [Streptomyces brasiliscabiei]|uniref:Uncharacterized protein n=1 Tax=Streptomyces brasiliscabiei TaxID=2736302 RepID=A0ABU8G9P9_9ACTN
MDPSDDPEAGAPAEPSHPFTRERRDTSIVERWDEPSRTYRCYEHGLLTVERPFTAAEEQWAQRLVAEQARNAARSELLSRARAAVAANRTYLDRVAAGTATNADHIAQVPALTRQMQALIRLVVADDLLDSAGGP